jgi:hypothetical protein
MPPRTIVSPTEAKKPWSHPNGNQNDAKTQRAVIAVAHASSARAAVERPNDRPSVSTLVSGLYAAIGFSSLEYAAKPLPFV